MGKRCNPDFLERKLDCTSVNVKCLLAFHGKCDSPTAQHCKVVQSPPQYPKQQHYQIGPVQVNTRNGQCTSFVVDFQWGRHEMQTPKYSTDCVSLYQWCTRVEQYGRMYCDWRSLLLTNLVSVELVQHSHFAYANVGLHDNTSSAFLVTGTYNDVRANNLKKEETKRSIYLNDYSVHNWQQYQTSF